MTYEELLREFCDDVLNAVLKNKLPRWKFNIGHGLCRNWYTFMLECYPEYYPEYVMIDFSTYGDALYPFNADSLDYIYERDRYSNLHRLSFLLKHSSGDHAP